MKKRTIAGASSGKNIPENDIRAHKQQHNVAVSEAAATFAQGVEHVKRYAAPLLAALVIVAGCGEQRVDIDTSIEVPVTVAEVTLSNIEEYISTTGTVEAINDYTVTSESSGYYRLADNPSENRPYMVGDRISDKAIIVHIDNPEQENSIGIDSQKLNLDISKSEYEKQQSLYEKGGVTFLELKTAEKSYIDADYSHKNALIQLEKLKVKAPFEGIIVDLPHFTEGVRIESGADMVRVMDYSQLLLTINIPGKMLGRIDNGQEVRITNYTIPDTELKGTVTQISPAIDSETRTFKATVIVNNPDLVLRPGMFVKADIVTTSRENTIVIPKDIIITRRNSKRVFVVERGFARERRITEGIENPESIEVLEGLSEGERIVVDGFITLNNGTKVKIVQ